MQLYSAKVQHFFLFGKKYIQNIFRKNGLMQYLDFPSTIHTDESVAEQLTGDNV